MNVYARMCTRVYVRMCMFACTCKCMCVITRVCIWICMFSYVHVSLQRAHKRASVHALVQVQRRVCVCVISVCSCAGSLYV